MLFCQRARVLRLRRTEQPLAHNAAAVLPSSYSPGSRHPDLPTFRSSIAGPTGPPVYASTDTSRCRLQDSRPGWIRYFLSCRGLSPPTTCRFSPAHGGLSATRKQSSLTGCRLLFHNPTISEGGNPSCRPPCGLPPRVSRG